MWYDMCYFIGKKLRIDPFTIINEWGCTKVLITYGYYINEITMQNYEEWKSMDSKYRGKAPKRYGVEFYTRDEILGMYE